MNKRGTSDIFIVILQMVIVGMVMAFMIAKVGAVDLENLKRTVVVQNLGLSMSTISFLPGSFSYTYLTENDGKMGDWKEFPVQIQENEIFYDEKAENVRSGNVKYQMYMNDLQHDMLERILMIKKRTLFIEKTDQLKTSDELKEDLRKLECQLTKHYLKVIPLKGGDETKYYDELGREVKTTIKENYIEMEKQHFSGTKQVYPGDRGQTNGNEDEATITHKLANMINEVEDTLIQVDKLAEKQIVLTVGSYEQTKNFMIIYAPTTNYEKNYNIGCTILNKILDTELKEQVDGIAIIPHQKQHIHFEIGNIVKPNNPTLINEANLQLIAEAIQNE